MTKKEKKVVAEVLKQALETASAKFDAEGPMSASWCYGYLIGTINGTIIELEK